MHPRSLTEWKKTTVKLSYWLAFVLIASVLVGKNAVAEERHGQHDDHGGQVDGVGLGIVDSLPLESVEFTDEHLGDLLSEELFHEDFDSADFLYEDDFVWKMTGLPLCNGYWGYYAVAEILDGSMSTSGMKYEAAPNCYMWATDLDGDGHCDCGDDDCGEDIMLSFYLGNHAESADPLSDMLYWNSLLSWFNVYYFWYDFNGRFYQQTPQSGRDNYNFSPAIIFVGYLYICKQYYEQINSSAATYNSYHNRSCCSTQQLLFLILSAG